MARNVFTVNAWIIDANGTKNTLSGYPKDFDSRNYQDDTEKAIKRATGDFCEVWGTMCKRDDRQMQVVTLSQLNGQLIDRKSMGAPVDPAPVEPEPQEEPEVIPGEGE